MNRFIIILFSFLIVSTSIIAQRGRGMRGKSKQQTLKGYISGNVIDSLSGETVEFAVVEVLAKRSGKQVSGALSDDNGHFKIEDIKTGKYSVKVSYLGYVPKIVDNVELTLSKPDKKLGNIYISPSSNMLDEVHIVDQRSLVESKIDKIVYNVSKDPTLTGGDATDVLRKVPMLSVDMDGNVSLRGSSKVKILLNGKPSGLFADDVGEALQMFPADEIKKVEVLTSPGAKYDGEGSAGIINIVTKKGIINGIKGSVRSFAGDKMESLHGSLAVGKGRFGMNTRLGARYKIPATSTNKFYRETYKNEKTFVYEQNGISEVSRLGIGGVIGGFYDFNAYNSFNTNLRLRGHGYDSDGFLDVENGDDKYKRYTNSTRSRSTYNWTTDYTKKFKRNKEQQLVIASQVEGNIQKNTNEKYYDYDPTIENNKNDGLNREITLQIDYVHPLNQAIKFELGAKTILRNLTSDFSRIYTLKPSNIDSVDNINTDIFYYDQNVYAGYLSGTFRLPHSWGVMTGVRYEHTQIKGDFDKFEKKFSNDYDNWFPSITVSKRFKDFSSLKFSYNIRIQRPSLTYINPFIDNKDPYSISYGNPYVSPENTQQYELGYSKFMKGSMINMSVYYRNTNDVIESYLFIDSSGVSNTTYYNIGKTDYFGVNLFASVKLMKILELRGNFDINKYYISGDVNNESLKNEGYIYNGFLSSNITLYKDWKAEVWGFFRSPRYTLQGKNPSFSIFSLGIQKEILNKKGKIGLRLVEPFKANKEFITELEGTDFYQKNISSIPFRSVGISFSYSFGKLDFKERKSFIKNDDLKQGGGDEQGNDSDKQ